MGFQCGLMGSWDCIRCCCSNRFNKGVTRNFKLTSFHKPGRILPSQTASSERHGSLWLVVQLQVVISVSQPGPKTDMDIIFGAGFLENNTRRLKKVMEDTSVKRTHTHWSS